MNYWTELSAQFAQQRNYLDELYKVYPIVPNIRRIMPEQKMNSIETAFRDRDNIKLINELLDWELFPLKDSYVAYLKRDRTAIERNPQTVNRIAGSLYQMGFDKMIEKSTEPKETNRQIGPMFKRWIDSGILGCKIHKNENSFLKDNNCVLNISDSKMKEFAQNYLGYKRDKGIDFIGKFNNKYIIAEAKFLTDFGGHQNAQFEDAISTMISPHGDKKIENEIVFISILDGVLYIKGDHKMYSHLQNHPEHNILSALLLREFLYSL